jgi:hypothetical protein
MWRAPALLLCALFLASVARFYHPGVGFTALILFHQNQYYQLPALREIPHYEYPPEFGYDGIYYSQLAMEPLLRNPEIDRALDSPAYRARRILFSWTAYLLGLGRPAWILEAYALQNVAAWLLLAWLITRWIPPVSGRLFALWCGAMFSHGLLASVRLALLDGPSMLLLALAVAASERGRTWTSAAILGVAGLGRETNLLGSVALPLPQGWKGWGRLAGAAVVVILPLLIWQDYLWSIYRGTSAAAGVNHITPPFVMYLKKVSVSLDGVRVHGLMSAAGAGMLALIALTTQVAFLVWSRQWREPWWRLAAAFAALLMVVDYVVWDGYPGAVTRVVLPLTFGFNVLLAKWDRGFWIWYVLGNLHLVAAFHVMPFPGMPPPF